MGRPSFLPIKSLFIFLEAMEIFSLYCSFKTSNPSPWDLVQFLGLFTIMRTRAFDVDNTMFGIDAVNNTVLIS